MASAPGPYPGYPPSYVVVDKIGGYTRNCIVIELLSIGPLDNVQVALIREQLEAVVAKLSAQIPIIEGSEIVPPERFDPVLCGGLRLPRAGC